MPANDNKRHTAYTEQDIYHCFPLSASGILTLSSVWHVLALKKKAVSSDTVQHGAAQSQIMLPAKANRGKLLTIHSLL